MFYDLSFFLNNINMNGNSQFHTSMSSGSLTAGIATMATTFLCKYMQLDMMQYGIVYGLMIAIFQYISSINVQEFKIEIVETLKIVLPTGLSNYFWIYTNYYYIWIIVIVSISLVFSFKYIKETYLNYMASSKSEYSFEFCSSNKVLIFDNNPKIFFPIL